MTTDPVEVAAFARGGVSRVDVWAIPVGQAGDWLIMFGVHSQGRYSEHPSPGYPVAGPEILGALRRLHGEVNPDGRTVALWIDPEPPLP